MGPLKLKFKTLDLEWGVGGAWVPRLLWVEMALERGERRENFSRPQEREEAGTKCQSHSLSSEERGRRGGALCSGAPRGAQTGSIKMKLQNYKLNF